MFKFGCIIGHMFLHERPECHASMQVFILAVLCLLFNERFRSQKDCSGEFMKPGRVLLGPCCSVEEFVFVEHYAGSKTMSGEIGSTYGRTAALDIEFHRGMDILSPAGFASETKSSRVYSQ